MELLLIRKYFPEGTNGNLMQDGKLVCHTIELPCKDNEKKISCIPEGKYLLRKRYSQKFKWHIEIAGVPDRSLILFHPANHAEKELNGCIAPVLKFSGSRTGIHSRKAFEKLKSLVYARLERNENVYLIVQS